MKIHDLKIGQGVIREVGNVLTENQISGKILYCSDPIVDDLYGDIVRNQIKEIGSLKQERCNYNTISYAMKIAEKVIATDIDCIIGFGGGRVLDVCKYAAYISKKPYLSLPTTAANDGIASPIAVLKREDDRPKSLGSAVPSMLLVDTDIIANGPLQNIKAGIGDTISNYTALKDWDLAVKRGKDSMNGMAYLMSENSLDALMKTQYHQIDLEFIKVLINSLVLSGVAMEFAGSSRPVSGSEHLFSHALDYYTDTNNLHGIQVALGTVAILKLIEEDAHPVLDYLNRFDVQINPKKLNIQQDEFIYCMQQATSMRKNRYTCLDELDLRKDRLEQVYKELVREL